MPLPDGCNPPPPTGDTTPVHTPCDEADKKAADSTFRAKFTELKNKALDTATHHESGYKGVPNASGVNQYITIDGTNNNPEIEFNFNTGEKVNFIMHNHYNSLHQLSVFSTSDFINSYDAMQQTSNFTSSTFSMALTTQLGTSYLMLIEDSTKFAAFTNLYCATGKAGELKLDKMYLLKYIVGGQSSNTTANELGFLRLMKDLNMGIALFRPNANFTYYTRLKLNANNTAVITEDCP
jgi:hypothetical protein